MVVTTAPTSPAAERRRREVRYAIMMGIRMVCFLLIIVVPGWWKLIALVGAVFLPGIAVITANAVDRRGESAIQPEPDRGRGLSTGPVLRGDRDDAE